MTIEERDNCLSMSSNILAKDLDALAATIYPEQDLQSVIIEDFNLTELFIILKRAIKQLASELKGDSWKILPNRFTDPHTNLTNIKQGSVLLTEQISYIDESLNDGSSFETWVPETLLLVRYEMHYGFWDRSKTRVHNPNDLNLAKTQANSELLLESIKISLEEVDVIQQKLEEGINKLDEFSRLKTAQFTSLEKTLDSASQSLTSVRDSEKDASTSSGKITTLLEQAERALEISREKIGQDRKTFRKLEEQVNALTATATDQIAQFSTNNRNFDLIIDSAREREQHILDQEEEIMRLIGHAADGRLATSFNEREKALSSRVDWWRNASIWVTILALAWAAFIFYSNNPTSDTKGINWLTLLANLIRTSPGFILMLFCQSQYTKERNIQEEYAFKAAVSRTVTSYADMIGTGEVNERVKMLIETIQRLYLPPVLGKPLKPFSIRSKDFAQTAKSMAEAAQSFKTAVTEVLPSIKLDGKSDSKPDKS
jgi:hypothetical protein